MNIDNSLSITLTEITDVISDFFISSGFTEVKTPLIIPAPVPEPNIDFIEKGQGFLRPSPEIEMKILLSKGYEKIFQIGPCFRKGEKGKYHMEKFTMLEWYETDADYNDLIHFTKEMLLFLTSKLFDSHQISYNATKINLAKEWKIFGVKEAFAKFAKTTPEKAIEQNRFEEIIVERLEPAFRQMDMPVILKDYPAEFAALAKLKKDDETVAERWELYLGGIEIANTYSELTDHDLNRSRFKEFARHRRTLKKKEISENEDFFRALKRGIPKSSGCALGIERLAMILLGEEHIKGVI